MKTWRVWFDGMWTEIEAPSGRIARTRVEKALGVTTTHVEAATEPGDPARWSRFAFVKGLSVCFRDA